MTSILRAGLILAVVAFLSAGCSEEKTPVAPAAGSETEAPKQPLIRKPVIADWCPEHAVPESIRTRCNEGLIADFKAKKDWCESHGLPDSQCLTCHPELKAKFEAMAPKPAK